LFDWVREGCNEGAWVFSNTVIGGLWVAGEGGLEQYAEAREKEELTRVECLGSESRDAGDRFAAFWITSGRQLSGIERCMKRKGGAMEYFFTFQIWRMF